MSKSKLIAIIADEDTCTGFLLGGIGEQSKGQVNFKVCNKETSPDEVAKCLKRDYQKTETKSFFISPLFF